MSNIGSHGMEKKKKKRKKWFIYVSTAQKAETSFVFMFTAIKSRGAEK